MSTQAHHGPHIPTVKSYIVGFVLSLVLTFTAFYFVNTHVVSGHTVYEHGFLTILVMALASVQLLVQSYFFLHLGQEEKPYWNLLFYLSTASLILLVVIASMWIMYHLNYNMTPTDMQMHILQDEGMQK